MTPRPTRALLAAAGLLAATAAAPGVAQAAEPKFTCEASALRATVLGQPIEPVVYGRGQECKTGETIPTIKLPELLDAAVLVAAGTKTDDALKPAATAAGGLTGFRVKLLPSLPIQLPTEQIIANIPDLPPIAVPGLGTLNISIKEAVRSLAPNGLLPQADLLSAAVLSSVAGASCADGKLSLNGASTVAGLRVLGQPVNVDSTLQQNLNVIDSASIDPSNITVAMLDLPPAVDALLGDALLGGALTAALQSALQPVLDALPNIEIPAAVAQVKITANTQSKTATTLTQQAIRVEASLVGTPLLDAVIGEAKVSAVGDCPVAARPDEQPAELGCTDRKLVLVDVFQQGSKGVKLKGAANRDFAGKTVSIRFQGDGNKVVATAKVGKNGGFSTFAPTPRASVRDTNKARYTAVRGKEKSLSLKLTRRMRVSRVLDDKKQVTITGFVRMPLAAPAATINLRQRIQCGKQKVIATTKPNSEGRYTFKVKSPDLPAVYRATTRVRNNTGNPKTYPTFTLPRGVDLLKR
ncbi:MAG: hypothetical protein H0V81_08685 [Solirubrobacterales bacterium]|nr:hypothetical protein [Solirubrobacterales bacterium]